eukprot:scaffold2022_cov261-Pinguiococcus_pyrenoidosus.AAC.9
MTTADSGRDSPRRNVGGTCKGPGSIARRGGCTVPGVSPEFKAERWAKWPAGRPRERSGKCWEPRQERETYFEV